MSGEAVSRRRAGSSWHSSFSRLFSRSPSKEEGEGDKAATQRQSSRSSGIMENDCSGVVYQRKESSPLPELLKISVCESKNFSTEELNSSTQEELKKANSLPSLVHQGRTSSNERKTREGFFQYLGSLFGISSKSSNKATEQSTLRDQHRTEKDCMSSANHQECGHNRLEPDIFVISSSVTEQGASNKHEEMNVIKCATSDTQDLPKMQEQSAELPKLAQLELGPPAVTYATYRGSARVKRLLKKQAQLEQEKQIETSVYGYKDNQSSVISDIEISTGLFSEKLKPENSDNENDSKVNTLLTDGKQRKEIQDVLDSNEQKELNNIALLTEEESIKSHTEEADFVKNASVPQTPEVNENLLLGPVLLPKEANSSCQNIGSVRMSLENRRLVEKGEELLGETQMHIQSNNAAVVGLQKGMHICASGNTETKANIQNEFSSNPKVDTKDYEQTLLASKYSYNNRTEEQFKKSVNQVLCSGQAVSKMINVNKDLYKNVTELENLQIISENVYIPLGEPKSTKEQTVVQDANCNKANQEKADLLTSAQSTEASLQEVEMVSKCGLKYKGTTDLVTLTSVESNPQFSMISENSVTTKHACMPPLEMGKSTMTKDFPSISEGNHTNAPLFAVGNDNMKANVLDTPSEINNASIDKAVGPVDGILLSLKSEDESCHCLGKGGQRETETEASEHVDVPLLPGDQTKFLEWEKTEFRNSTESTTVATPNPSFPKMIEELVSKSKANDAEKNTSIDDGMRNDSEAEMPSDFELKRNIVIDLPPPSLLQNMHLPKDASSVIQSENNNSLTVCSYPLPSVISNAFIFKENNVLEIVPKSVLNSEDQSVRSPTLTSSSETKCSKIFSSSGCENVQIISKADICGSQSHPLGAESEQVDQISDAFPQPRNKSETKVTSDTTEIPDIRSMIIPCFQEAKDITESSSVDAMPYTHNATCIKDTLKSCSPPCERIDVTFGNTTSLPIDSVYDKGSISPKYKSNGLPSEATDSILASFDCDIEAVKPAKKVLGMPFTTKQSREVHISTSEQLHYFAAVEMDDQASTALFTKPSNQFFEEPLKDVETKKELQIKSQDVALLFKKADEIVDAVLHLAIEEVRSKQATSVCQTNGINDNLLRSSLHKDQESRKMLSESKEIKRLSSLKDFNENCIQKLSEINKEDTLDMVTLDDKVLFDITDQIDLHSSAALKAKEIIDDVINAAKQKLACGQYEEHFSKSVSQNKDFRSDTEASKCHITNTGLVALPPKINEEPAAVSCMAGDSETASPSTPFCLEIKDSKEVTRTRLIPNSVYSCQKNKDEWGDPVATEQSSSAQIHNSKHSNDDNCNTDTEDSGSKTNNSAADDTSDYFLVNDKIAVAGELLPSCTFMPENVPHFNSNVETHTCSSSKSKGECGSNVKKNLLKCVFKDSGAAEVVREKPQENHCATGSERYSNKMEGSCLMTHHDRFDTRNSISESPLMNSTMNFGLNSDFHHKEETPSKPDLTMHCIFKESYQEEEEEDGENSPKSFLCSPPEPWESKSSFTILYEGTLQDQRYCISTEEPDHLLPFPGQSLTKSKLEFACSYSEDNQLNKVFDNTCSESFMTVEAKRYKVYPFSLSPIYEDDSSEDLLSTDISPDQHSEKSRDNQSLSVLSLLQSVSERLKSSEWCHEEEKENFLEEDKVEDERELCISSQWPKNLSAANSQNLQDSLYSRDLHFFSTEIRSPEDALPFSSLCSTQILQKSDPPVKLFSKRVCYETSQNSRSSSVEKGTKFGSILLPKDLHQEGSNLQTPATFQVCPVDRELLKCNPRPGKMVIFGASGKIHEIYHDVEDTTAWMFSKETLIRIVRGCWILYKEPRFQGQKYILEEGDNMLCDILNCHNENGNFKIGSVRRVMKYCSVPEIHLCPQDGTEYVVIRIQSAIHNSEELELKNPTLSVKAGVWLAYSDINYKGEVMVLEENHSPCEISAADVKSLHPLTMGGLRVQMPMNIKMIIYGRPHFQGWHKELSENTDCLPMLFENTDDFQGVGSIHVVGGIWVAYNKERYKGQQYLLEEGEYEDCQSWGGMNGFLLSFRFLQADFMESEITLLETDEEDGNVLNVINQEIPDLEQAGFGVMARSIHVKSGVWVAYHQKYFCGQQYILEKGKYTCFFDWGGSSETIMSIRPIKLEPLGDHEPTHWLKAFSNTHFQGSCTDITTEITDFASFKPCSFKIIRGCWLLHYQGKNNEGHCVLEEDLYTDLASCGCPAAVVTSLKPIDYVFAEPLISLFALQNCEGRELNLQEAVSSVLNKDPRFLTQSIWVRSGLWIAYDGNNFLGNQLLLEPNRISNWTQFSGWKTIGSLRPVKQPAVYFRIKNRSQDKYLTIAGNLMDPRATSLCLSPLNRKDTQIWHYTGGLIKSKVNDACLDVIGGRDVPGAKVALWVKHGKARQKWKLNNDGTLSSYLSEQLVLDIKGGYYYDRNHIVINQVDTSECTQKWDFEIL